jgi:hypothetical protein
MSDGWMTIKLRAENGATLAVKFEPLGQIYTLESGQCMYADLLSHNDESDDTLEIISTPGMISIWPPGHVQTRDQDGNKLDWPNSPAARSARHVSAFRAAVSATCEPC